MLDHKLGQALDRLHQGAGLDAAKDLGLSKDIDRSCGAGSGPRCTAWNYTLTQSTTIQCLHEVMQSLTQHLHSHLQWQKSVALNRREFEFEAAPASRRKRGAGASAGVGLEKLTEFLIWRRGSSRRMSTGYSVALN